MSTEMDIVERIHLMRGLGRHVLTYLDAFMGNIPDDIVVDTLLMVAVTRAKMAGLDTDKLAQEFAKTAKHAPEEE
jgi:hypothetical protein